MCALKSAEVRELFLRFFADRGHRRVPSSPLIPANDKSLLFTNSGMVQFKDVFLGFDDRPYKRAVTAQKCLRAGGKHNDLDNVGYTGRHHTFFEMLGNFSFGDYFKGDAIRYAWEFLTSPEWLGLDRRHLWVTVFGGGHLFGPDSPEIPWDEEAHRHWKAVLCGAGFSADEAEARIARIPTTDNFWMMGDVGPCGPCSEIFYNFDAHADVFEGEDKDKADTCVEIWNLVFMQFSRDEKGTLRNLPKPCVDTGMGLERISCVLQGAAGNFGIDLFEHLIAAAREAVGPGAQGGGASRTSALRVIVDHVRSAAFLIADGVRPGNDGRGYVLRRIVRRALRHGHQLGAPELFFRRLAGALADLMGDAYPELVAHQGEIARILGEEEKSFAKTLSAGMAILDREIARLETAGDSAIKGEVAFELYDTYGFPLDLTADIARAKGLSVDGEAFDRLMREQQERSRAAAHFAAEAAVEYDGAPTEFVGYGTLECEARVAALFVDGTPAREARAGAETVAVLSPTPFYARAGGQVGDAGEVLGPGVRATVLDTYRLRNDVAGSLMRIDEGALKVGDAVACAVDVARRAGVCANHSATHLMHAALREVLGPHVGQRGSLVAPDHLRFDFSHNAPLGREQMQEVERRVNEQIRLNHEVAAEEMEYRKALETGAMALFGEKYGDVVRVVTISPYSVELCGGTHAARSGDIGLFKFASESPLAAGVRRVEARTGDGALAMVQKTELAALETADKVRVSVERMPESVGQLRQALQALEKELEAVRDRENREEARRIMRSAREVAGARVAVRLVEGKSPQALRSMAESVLAEGGDCVMLLTSVEDGRASLVALVGKALEGAVDARDVVNVAAAELGGRGGGRPNLAQAGGKARGEVARAHEAAEQLIVSRLQAR